MSYDGSTGTGLFDFGFIDPAKFTGSIGFAPSIQPTGFFEVTTTGYYLGTSTTIHTLTWNIIVDTGTGDSRVPQAAADAYHAQIPGSMYLASADGYVYPCSNTNLPDFTVQLTNGVKVTWPGSGIATTFKPDGTNCFSNLKRGTGQNFIWGDTFIESVFVVFDYDNRRVGFASKPKSGSPTGTLPPAPPPSPTPNGSVSQSFVIFMVSETYPKPIRLLSNESSSTDFVANRLSSALARIGRALARTENTSAMLAQISGRHHCEFV